ncbi:MAG: putative quinol monooxygenase [Xanthobacteraceae bacterium]|jgi:autoinducer 2-degrading protein
MIAIVVELKVPSNGAKDFRALAEQHARRCLEREPGCLQFDITQDPADPEQWLFYERYRDEAALDAHRKTDYLAKFLESTRSHITDRKMRRLDVRVDTLKV